MSNTNSFLSTFKSDFRAGIVVWLVALPLCLGIAQGSEADPFTGLIAGIVGGIVVTIFSGSKFGVSGPAAGLITIVIAAITDLGFTPFLLALVIAGVMQLLLGIFRLGVIGYFVPVSVINGMLASIGIILILKQVPHALGIKNVFTKDFSIFDQGIGATMSEIMNVYQTESVGALLIFGISMAIILLWQRPFLQKFGFFKTIPASLFAVAIGAILNQWFISAGGSVQDTFVLSANQLVSLPEALFTRDFGNLLESPDFTAFTNPIVYKYAIILALVASIETLLSLEATDKLDPDKNVSSANKELKAQGIGNIISGFLGGLPITQVIVRSSANINSKAKSQMSAIYHGILLLISVLTFPKLLAMIPLASLAAILIILGYKLANIQKMINSYKSGLENFIPMITTIAAVLLTDLLTGVAIGFVVSMFFVLKKNYQLAFTTTKENSKSIITFSQIVTFLNKGSLKDTLMNIPNENSIVINAEKCNTMSDEIVEVIKDYVSTTAKKKNIQVELLGLEKFGYEIDSNS